MSWNVKFLLRTATHAWYTNHNIETRKVLNMVEVQYLPFQGFCVLLYTQLLQLLLLLRQRLLHLSLHLQDIQVLRWSMYTKQYNSTVVSR